MTSRILGRLATLERIAEQVHACDVCRGVDIRVVSDRDTVSQPSRCRACGRERTVISVLNPYEA